MYICYNFLLSPHCANHCCVLCDLLNVLINACADVHVALEPR